MYPYRTLFIAQINTPRRSFVSDRRSYIYREWFNRGTSHSTGHWTLGQLLHSFLLPTHTGIMRCNHPEQGNYRGWVLAWLGTASSSQLTTGRRKAPAIIARKQRHPEYPGPGQSFKTKTPNPKPITHQHGNKEKQAHTKFILRKYLRSHLPMLPSDR